MPDNRDRGGRAHHRPEQATALESLTLGVQEVVARIEVVADEVNERNKRDEWLHQAEHTHQQHCNGMVCKLWTILQHNSRSQYHAAQLQQLCTQKQWSSMCAVRRSRV